MVLQTVLWGNLRSWFNYLSFFISVLFSLYFCVAYLPFSFSLFSFCYKAYVIEIFTLSYHSHLHDTHPHIFPSPPPPDCFDYEVRFFCDCVSEGASTTTEGFPPPFPPVTTPPPVATPPPRKECSMWDEQITPHEADCRKFYEVRAGGGREGAAGGAGFFSPKLGIPFCSTWPFHDVFCFLFYYYCFTSIVFEILQYHLFKTYFILASWFFSHHTSLKSYNRICIKRISSYRHDFFFFFFIMFFNIKDLKSYNTICLKRISSYRHDF